MVLNLTNFAKFCKSLPTPWKASYMLANEFLTCFWICLSGFLALSQGSEISWFWPKSPCFWTSRILVSPPNRSKLPETPEKCLKMISNTLRDYWCRVQLNSWGSQIDRFCAKDLGYCPWYWRWRILASPRNRSKLPETPPKYSKMPNNLCRFRVNSRGSQIHRFLANRLEPGVLNMADFGNYWISFQTHWNEWEMLETGFLNSCATVSFDFRWIRKRPKLTDFEQNAWAIAHGFEHWGFWQVLEVAPNSLKMLQNGFLNPCTTVCVEFWWIPKYHKLAVFEQKPWAIAQGFGHARFWQVLKIATNSLKRLLNAWKWMSNTLQDYFCRFRVNSPRSPIERSWAKGLGYSPWFWTCRNFATPGNRSKVPETPAKRLKMDF